jgi:hypothetical protein
VIALVPVANALAFTLSEAVPAAEREAVPKLLLPRLNVTVPVGAALPLAALTVAVSDVDPVVLMDVGLAVRVVVVATTGMVTVTVAAAVDVAKLPVGV